MRVIARIREESAEGEWGESRYVPANARERGTRNAPLACKSASPSVVVVSLRAEANRIAFDFQLIKCPRPIYDRTLPPRFLSAVELRSRELFAARAHPPIYGLWTNLSSRNERPINSIESLRVASSEATLLSDVISEETNGDGEIGRIESSRSFGMPHSTSSHPSVLLRLRDIFGEGGKELDISISIRRTEEPVE